MKVTLAGCNVDRGLLDELAAASGAPGRPPLSPETISAAYARISRDPRPVGELRRIARTEVAAARRSNRRIVYDMGHASIAEHAVFNLDVEGVSRLAAEALESHRLASFTEKSQRYIVLEADHVVPAEIAGGPVEAGFRALVARQASLYADLMATLAGRGSPPESAREDARYALPLAAATQLGMTANARTLELIVRRLAASPLAGAARPGGRDPRPGARPRPLAAASHRASPGRTAAAGRAGRARGRPGRRPGGDQTGSGGRRGAGCGAPDRGQRRARPARPLALLYPAAGRAAAELGAQLAGLSDEEVGRDIRRVLADLGRARSGPKGLRDRRLPLRGGALGLGLRPAQAAPDDDPARRRLPARAGADGAGDGRPGGARPAAWPSWPTRRPRSLPRSAGAPRPRPPTP